MARGDDRPFAKLDDDFQRQVRPVLTTYCLKCHSTELKEGELDLERFAALADVRKDVRAWQKVAEMLDQGEMPPKDQRQPTADERKTLREWVRRYLDAEARASAGDPGRVVLRRLSNAEYTYTIRDLTGVAALSPAREFPIDGAAGEGFTNTGAALVMSPALFSKYLDAAKTIAAHAVLLPDGIRFSPKTTRRDWTDEIVTQIRDTYQPFTDASGATRVNLQGLVWDTNQGGRLPLEKYLAALLAEREAIATDKTTTEAIARQRKLSPKYMRTLWDTLSSSSDSLLLGPIRARFRTAKPDDASVIAADIARWQQALWKFSSVGHIGKVGGPKAWMEPVSPLAVRHEFRFKIPASSDGKQVSVFLAAADAGDGNDHDFVVWEKPRLVAPGRPDLPLRDVRAVSHRLEDRRQQVFASAANCLAAAAEASAAKDTPNVDQLARRHGIQSDVLTAWLDYLGLGAAGPVKIDSLLTNKITGSAGYSFIQGFGSSETPSVVANSSDNHVRIPGHMHPHTVAVHPSPTLRVAAGWKCPIATTVRVEAKIQHAHPECGNGISWTVELRRGATRQQLAAGVAQGATAANAGPIEKLAVRPGDLISLLVAPRDGNHACDLTAVELSVTSATDGRRWELARDVADDILAGNPHADRSGNPSVWHFYTEPDRAVGTRSEIPPGSLLAKWQSAERADEKQRHADSVQELLKAGPPAAKDNPDAVLYHQLASLGGPLLSAVPPTVETPLPANAAQPSWGLDPALFGRHANGAAIDATSLRVRAPSVVEIRLPADLVEGYELVTTGTLDARTGREGSVQLHVLGEKPKPDLGLVAPAALETAKNAPWTSNNRGISHATPIIVNENSDARRRIEQALAEFRDVFPPALCYTRIVPVDEVVTLTLYHREDDHLRRLMLDDAQAARLDRLWDELHYVSHDALTLVDAFAQLMEYATQDADPKVFEPLRKPIHDRAAAFRKRLVDTEPRHVDAVLEFAARAYRRPVTAEEKQELRSLYDRLRKQDVPHDEAIRLTLARVLVAPQFLYKLEQPGPAADPVAVSDWELATRLSYFLWSSLPDEELRSVAASGRLRDPAVLAAQTRRMLRDDRVRRLATEFACQWLHIHDFAALDEKSERHFPTFIPLREAMYEESIRFFTDLFQRDGGVWEILDADHTFLNEPLAKHYGIPGVTGDAWRRVDGVKRVGRGGILAQATTLAKQSGASRTSPILRGNWVSEVLLGEKLPRPPKDVPQLPQDEADTNGLTVRQLVEKHSADPDCAVCHRRIDAYGLALEGYDAIGRLRDKDLGGRPIDTNATAMDGKKFDGLAGLRGYLLTTRRDAFLRQFCRKLLGYALGRSVELSDEPLLADMRAKLESDGYHINRAVEAIVASRQFREIRGRGRADDE